MPASKRKTYTDRELFDLQKDPGMVGDLAAELLQRRSLCRDAAEAIKTFQAETLRVLDEDPTAPVKLEGSRL